MIRVLVIDNFTPWHEFVATALGSDSRYEVVGFASDAPGGIEQSQALKPDVILLDINLPGFDGMTAAAKIREIAPATKIILFTTHLSLEFVNAALEVGVHGFVAKLDGRELLTAFNTVISGEGYLSTRIRALHRTRS